MSEARSEVNNPILKYKPSRRRNKPITS